MEWEKVENSLKRRAGVIGSLLMDLWQGRLGKNKLRRFFGLNGRKSIV